MRCTLVLSRLMIVVGLLIAPTLMADEAPDAKQDQPPAPVLGQNQEAPSSPEEEESALCTSAVPADQLIEVDEPPTPPGGGPGGAPPVGCTSSCSLGQTRYFASNTCCCHTLRKQVRIETCQQITSTCRGWRYSGVSCNIGVFCESNQCL